MTESVLQDHYGFLGSIGYAVIKDGYDNKNKLAHIACPTIIIHGKKDKMVLPEQSINIYSRR